VARRRLPTRSRKCRLPPSPQGTLAVAALRHPPCSVGACHAPWLASIGSGRAGCATAHRRHVAPSRLAARNQRLHHLCTPNVCLRLCTEGYCYTLGWEQIEGNDEQDPAAPAAGGTEPPSAGRRPKTGGAACTTIKAGVHVVCEETSGGSGSGVTRQATSADALE